MRFLSLIALTVAAATANAQRCPTGSWGTALAVQFASPRFLVADGPAQTVSPATPAPAGKFDVSDPRDGGVYHCATAEQAEAVKAMIAGRSGGKVPAAAPAPKTSPAPAPKAKTADADRGDLDEVNAQRAKRGLPPYKLDPDLTRAAQAAAEYRAANRIEGHTSNDFIFVTGTRAAAAGCAAWPVGMGWGSCCIYDNYRFAGAGSRIGPDGRRYMHLFVR